MGFSVSAAAAIIGVSLIIVLGSLTGNLLPSLTEGNDAFTNMKERALDRLQTGIAIQNVSTPANGSNYDLNFTVENIGSVTLEISYFTILINGTRCPFICSSSYAYIENEVNLTITNLSGSGTRRLKVITGNGVADYYDYVIT